MPSNGGTQTMIDVGEGHRSEVHPQDSETKSMSHHVCCGRGPCVLTYLLWQFPMCANMMVHVLNELNKKGKGTFKKTPQQCRKC